MLFLMQTLFLFFFSLIPTMDAVTSCLVVFQVSVFILQFDHINGQPLYEHPREDSLKESGHLFCRKYYGKELFDCLMLL